MPQPQNIVIRGFGGDLSALQIEKSEWDMSCIKQHLPRFEMNRFPLTQKGFELLLNGFVALDVFWGQLAVARLVISGVCHDERLSQGQKNTHEIHQCMP